MGVRVGEPIARRLAHVDPERSHHRFGKPTRPGMEQPCDELREIRLVPHQQHPRGSRAHELSKHLRCPRCGRQLTPNLEFDVGSQQLLHHLSRLDAASEGAREDAVRHCLDRPKLRRNTPSELEPFGRKLAVLVASGGRLVLGRAVAHQVEFHESAYRTLSEPDPRVEGRRVLRLDHVAHVRMGAHGAVVLSLSAWRFRQASRRSVSYPRDSTASATSGSRSARAFTQAASVVNASTSARRRLPAGAPGEQAPLALPPKTARKDNVRALPDTSPGRLHPERVRSIALGQKDPTMDDKNRTKALELAIAGVEKEFGKGAIMRLKDGESLHPDVPVVPTGSIGLDLALGIGGYPRGRIVEIYGPESSGKTTLTLHAIANVQKQGGVAAFIDAEHALDVVYAKKLGVNTEELLISQPDYGEQALEIADMLVRSNAVDLVVVDSVAALVPKAEIEGDMGDSHVGTQARLMSQALRKLTGTVARSQCLLMFINQIRMKIGVMFGSPETTTGGNALKFYASVRLDIRRIGAIKEAAALDKKEPGVVGNRTKVKVVKNKMAPPFREVEFDILYGQGISRAGDVLDLASEEGIVEKSGAWFSFQSDRIGQGRENARTFLEQHPPILDKIEQLLLVKHGVGRASVGAQDSPPAKGTSAPPAARDSGAKSSSAPSTGKDGANGAKEPAAAKESRASSKS